MSLSVEQYFNRTGDRLAGGAGETDDFDRRFVVDNVATNASDENGLFNL